MKSFHSVFTLFTVIFLCQLSNQFETSQNEWPMQKPFDSVSPSTDDTLVTGSFDTNEFLSKWFLKRFVAKHSNWVKLKELKAITFSHDAFTTGRKHRRQLNCLGEEGLCDHGPTHVSCAVQPGYNSSDYTQDLHEHYHQHYHCSALTPSNLKFDRLSISCETKLDGKAEEDSKTEDGKDEEENVEERSHAEENVQVEDIDRILVLKGSCYLSYTLIQIDYAPIVLKLIIAVLCFIVAFVVVLYTFSTCRDPERGSRVFLTPFYFTRSNAHQFGSINSLYD